MSDNKRSDATPYEACGDFAGDVEHLDLRDLPPCTTLFLRTRNSCYRVVVSQWPEVCVQGGTYFPDPTTACLDGTPIGENYLTAGWISVDRPVEFRLGGQRIITSRLRAILTDHRSDPIS